MNRNSCLSALLLALLCSAPSLALPDSTKAVGVIDARKLAKVIPGTSKTQVKLLLGAPWRTVQYNDLDDLEDEIWEYRGEDSSGRYRIHIEFDHHDRVRILSRIADGAPAAKGAPPAQ